MFCFLGQREQTPAMMQMKLEKSIDDRMWVTSMTKHVMEMNKDLQSRLLDIMQCPHEHRLIPEEKETETPD